MENTENKFKFADITPESKQDLDRLENKLSEQLDKPIILVAYEEK